MSDDKNRGAAESPDPGEEEKEVKAWEGAINRTLQWRDGIADKEGWKRFIKEFKGNWDFQQQNLDIPVIPINLVFAWIKTEIARMYFKDPWITVNPKKVEGLGAAQVAEQIINYLWGEIGLKREIKRVLQDALTVGHGWIKVGYTATFGLIENKETVKRKQGRPKKEELPVDTNECVKSENVFAVRYPWKDVLFDPAATYPAHLTARWIAFRWVKPLRAIKESSLFDKDATEQLKASDLGTKSQGSDKPQGKDVQVATGWEIWDRDHGKVVTVSAGVKKYLREVEWPEESTDKDGNLEFPAVMLGFNPVDDEPFPVSDIAEIEPLIIEKIKCRAIQLNHLKRWNRQIFMRPDLMTPENKANFKQAIDGAIIEVQGKPGEDFFIPPYAPVQQDIYGIENSIDKDLYEVAGQTPQDRGAPGKAQTRTVGELRMQLQGSGSRAEERKDVLEDFCAEVARKIFQVIQTKFDIPRVARLVGPRAMDKAMLASRPSAQPQEGMQPPTTTDNAFSWNRMDMQGEMDVDVIAGSTVPMDKESQLQIFEKLGPVLPFFGITPASPAARTFGREVLRLIGIMSLESVMDLADEQAAKGGPPPNPMAAKAQMEMQKGQMKMEIDKQKAGLQMEGLKAKVEADKIKAQIKIEEAQHKLKTDMLKSVLDQFMQPEPVTNGNGQQ